GDDHIAAFFDREAGGTQQFAVTAAGLTEFADELPAGIEHRYRVGPFIRAIDPIPPFVDSDAKRPSRVAVAFAIFKKVVQQFLFVGTAELHLVGVHTEIVLVTPVGCVEDAVLAEAHPLNVIKSSAAGSTSSDGMAPVEYATARDCC